MGAIRLISFLSFALLASRFTYGVTAESATAAYDFVIVGGNWASMEPISGTDWSIGGTAGSVLANRLTENPNVSVLVIEAGGT